MTTEGGGGERTDPANADRPGSAPPRETRRRRGTRIIRALLVTALVAGLLVGALAALQRQLIYFPTRSDPGPAANHLPGGQDITLHTEDGLDLNAWLLPPPPPPTGTSPCSTPMATAATAATACRCCVS